MSASKTRGGPLVRLAASRLGSRWFLGPANRIDRWLVPATNGRLSSAPGQNVCVVETIGAKSGQVRRVPLQYAMDGDAIVLVASSGGAPKHPAWFHNVRAHPDVRVWANGGRSGRYRARVADGEERERLWRIGTARYPGYDTYQERAGGRVIPVVTLSPLAGGP